MINYFLKTFISTLFIITFTNLAQAESIEQGLIFTPIGKHAREVKQIIEFDLRNCRRYTVGAGIGCMTRSVGSGMNIILLGSESPCRKNGTVQLDFTDDFYLLAISCGSNKELSESFIKQMNTTYGRGQTSGSQGADFIQNTWKYGKTTVTVSEISFSNTKQYKIMVHKKI